MKHFKNIIIAFLISRSNRFVVECIVGGRNVRTSLPNPCRLWGLP